MGIVQTFLTGKDGYTRAAIVKIANTERLLKGSLRHLFPMEINCQATVKAITRYEPEEVCVPDVTPRPRCEW